MNRKNIEIDLLYFFGIEAIFFLFFFKNSLLSLLISSIIAIFLIKIYQKLNCKKNILFKIILLMVTILTSIIVLDTTTKFIEFNILKNYPQLIITITFLALTVYLAIKGYHSLTKSLEMTCYINIILQILAICLLIPYLNFNNFTLPIPYQELNINTSIIVITLSYFLFYVIIDYLTNKKITFKVITYSYLIPIIFKIFTISIIATNLVNLEKYPYMSILKYIQYLDFIERMEGILSLPYFFNYTFLMSAILLTVKLLITDLFKIKNTKTINIILVSLALIIIIIKYLI